MGKVAVALMALAVAPLGAASVTDTRTIPDNITLAVPLFRCAVPTMAARIARSAGIPGGIESVPDCAQLDPTPPRNLPPTLTFLGKTVADALDELMALDSRYRWAETDGVILVRPLEAWNDAKHFMSATIPQFGFDNQKLETALAMIAQAIHGEPNAPRRVDIALPTEQGGRQFSVTPRTLSIIEAANATVRAHGALMWTLTYCRPAREMRYASFMLRTFDRTGLGIVPPAVAGADGRRVSPCAGTEARTPNQISVPSCLRGLRLRCVFPHERHVRRAAVRVAA